MSPRIVNEEDICAELNKAILEGLWESFVDGKTEFGEERGWHGSMPSYSVVIEEAGRVTAHVGVVDRTIRVGDVQVRAAGVQNVFVVPDRRGKGLVADVMNAAMKEASTRGFDAGLLFCVPELERVYERCGWLTLPEVEITRIDEHGREVVIPEKNIGMFYPLLLSSFPTGDIHLQGNDW